MCAHYFFLFVFKYQSPITPEIRFSNPYSKYSLFFKHIWNSVRFLLNVERDKFGLRRRKASPFANLFIKCMIWRIVRVLEGCCLFIMRLHVKGRFPVKWLANLILFTKPSAVSVAAVKWIDSRAWLQFQFFLNLFSRPLATNLSRRNDRSRTGPQTLLRFQRNGKRQWIPFTFHAYSRYLAATRDIHSAGHEVGSK